MKRDTIDPPLICRNQSIKQSNIHHIINNRKPTKSLDSIRFDSPIKSINKLIISTCCCLGCTCYKEERSFLMRQERERRAEHSYYVDTQPIQSPIPTSNSNLCFQFQFQFQFQFPTIIASLLCTPCLPWCWSQFQFQIQLQFQFQSSFLDHVIGVVKAVQGSEIFDSERSPTTNHHTTTPPAAATKAEFAKAGACVWRGTGEGL